LFLKDLPSVLKNFLILFLVAVLKTSQLPALPRIRPLKHRRSGPEEASYGSQGRQGKTISGQGAGVVDQLAEKMGSSSQRQ
jgi:hypothetical protein